MLRPDACLYTYYSYIFISLDICLTGSVHGVGIAWLVDSYVSARFPVPMDTEGSSRIVVSVFQTERVWLNR